MNVKFSVEGGEELARKLKRIGDDLRAILEEAVLAGLQPMLDQAERDVPGGDGVAHETVEKTGDRVDIAMGAEASHFYLNILELGRVSYQVKPSTAKALASPTIRGEFASSAKIPALAAQPWLRPAFDENKDKAMDEMADAFWEAIEKHLE